MLDLDLQHRQGSFELRVTVQIGSGLTAINGASGSGKTTLLKIVAGLIRPEIGRVTFDTLFFADTARGLWLPPHKRRCGVVFQEARLFPHLTVKQNLLYGQWFNRRSNKRETRQDIIALLGIEMLLGRAPATLSGGEAQRVALGRALLANPRLLLMDEPLSALDSARKEEILPYLERVRDHARIPILYVSHTQSEIERLANRVITLKAGQILTSASPSWERPAASPPVE